MPKEQNAKAQNAVPLAVVGMACRFPKSDDQAQFWELIENGTDGITPIPDEGYWKVKDFYNEDKNAPDMTYGKRGGFINPVDFEPLAFGMSLNNIEATDTTQLLGMVAARDALLDAKYSTSPKNEDGRAFDRDRCSVILGVTGTLELVIPLGARLGHPKWKKALEDAGVDDETAKDVMKRIAHEYVPWQENSFPGLLGNVAAGRIANKFDLGGTNCVCDAACGSSLSAVHMAAMELYTGKSDMVITGGVDTFNDIFMYMCFSKTPALSATGNSKPFAKNGDGTILGEGLGVVVLKRLDDAQRDGDTIHAVIRGIGTSSDGAGNAVYAPSSSGQAKAVRDAYTNANIEPGSIELVEAHGTGTKVGDAVEFNGLKSIYEAEATERQPWCAVGSVKSQIGHTKAAAGAAGLIKAVLALKHKVLPPTIKVDEPLDVAEPGSAPLYVNTQKRPWIPHGQNRLAAVSAFGFGGSNYHCVLEEAQAEKATPQWDGQVQLISLGASSTQELASAVNKLSLLESWTDVRAVAQESRKANIQASSHRLCLVAQRDDSFAELQSGER